MSDQERNVDFELRVTKNDLDGVLDAMLAKAKELRDILGGLGVGGSGGGMGGPGGGVGAGSSRGGGASNVVRAANTASPGGGIPIVGMAPFSQAGPFVAQTATRYSAAQMGAFPGMIRSEMSGADYSVSGGYASSTFTPSFERQIGGLLDVGMVAQRKAEQADDRRQRELDRIETASTAARNRQAGYRFAPGVSSTEPEDLSDGRTAGFYKMPGAWNLANGPSSYYPPVEDLGATASWYKMPSKVFNPTVDPKWNRDQTIDVNATAAWYRPPSGDFNPPMPTGSYGPSWRTSVGGPYGMSDEATRQFDSSDIQGIRDWRSNITGGSQGYGMRFGKAALFAGAEALSAYGAWETQAALTGRHDPMAGWGIAGTLAGGLLGGAIGSVFPGYGSLIGAGIGAQAGSELTKRIGAPELRTEQQVPSAVGIGNLDVGLHPELRSATTEYAISRPLSGGQPQLIGRGVDPSLDRINLAAGLGPATFNVQTSASNLAARLLKEVSGKEQVMPNTEEILSSYGTLSTSLIAGGEDPFGLVGGSAGHIGYSTEQQRFAAGLMSPRRGTGTTIVDRLEDVANTATIAAMKPGWLPGGGQETLLEQITRRASERYLKGQADVIKEVAPVYSSLPETGSNVADILTRFGATTTYRYGQLQVEKGQADPYSLKELMDASVGFRQEERQGAFISTRARGVGTGLAQIYGEEMETLGRLPGGRDSLAYAQANQSRRAARMQSFTEHDIEDYDIPMAHLSGVRARENVLPFSPGNIFATDLQIIQRNNQQAGVLTNRLGSLRSSGDLSETQELEMTRQIESLKTSNASMIAELSEGMENRLPALSAGRPSFFSRMNSYQLAAMRLNQANSPRRSFGAINGAQMQMQDDFVDQLSGGMDIHATSRTMNLNNQAGGNVGPQLVALLQQLVAIASGSGGMGYRGNDTTGGLSAALGRKADTAPIPRTGN